MLLLSKQWLSNARGPHTARASCQTRTSPTRPTSSFWRCPSVTPRGHVFPALRVESRASVNVSLRIRDAKATNVVVEGTLAAPGLTLCVQNALEGKTAVRPRDASSPSKRNDLPVSALFSVSFRSLGPDMPFFPPAGAAEPSHPDVPMICDHGDVGMCFLGG